MIEWTGIEVLYWFQSLRESAPPIQSFFLLISSSVIYLAMPLMIACVFYWLVDKRAGEIISLSFISAMVFASLAKFGIAQPRPWDIDPNLEKLPWTHANGYSCPSGHAAITSSAFGATALLGGSRKVAIAMVILIILVSLSRIVLGVHTPLDVAIGLLIGLVSIPLASKAVDLSYRSDGMFYLVHAIYIVIFTVLFIITGILWGASLWEALQYSGFVYGLAIARILEHAFVRFEIRDWSNKEKLLRYFAGMLIGATLLLAPSAYIPTVGNIIGGFLIMLWCFCIYPWVMVRSS